MRLGVTMGISAKDLNPLPSSFLIGKKEYKMRDCDLLFEIWAHEKFSTPEETNGLIAFSRLASDLSKPKPILQAAYHLLVDDSDFANEEDFIIQIGKRAGVGKKYYTLNGIYQAMARSFGLSQPLMDEIAEDQELKKQVAAV